MSATSRYCSWTVGGGGEVVVVSEGEVELCTSCVCLSQSPNTNRPHSARVFPRGTKSVASSRNVVSGYWACRSGRDGSLFEQLERNHHTIHTICTPNLSSTALPLPLATSSNGDEQSNTLALTSRSRQSSLLLMQAIDKAKTYATWTCARERERVRAGGGLQRWRL